MKNKELRMNKYNRISILEREKIYKMKLNGESIANIAKELGRHKSTICREINRNSVDYGYNPLDAQMLAKERITTRTSKIERDSYIKQYIIDKLKLLWSPQRIAGRLRREGYRICHEVIYQFIYSAYGRMLNLYQYLKYRRPARFPKGLRKPQMGKILHKTSIHTRPDEANLRLKKGHFEADLMMTHNDRKENLLVMTDRKSRLVLIAHNIDKRAKTITEKLENNVKKHKIKSITFDNGKEFAYHHTLKCKTFFCDTYSPWQKGSVEHINGRIRNFFNKGFNDIAQIQHIINNTPMKILDFLTPNEVYLNCCTTK
jgi:IS30 family transposase